MNTNISRFYRNDEASVVPVFTMLLIPIALIIGSAIDFGGAYAEKIRLQDIVDSAALAAASMEGDPSDSERIAAAEAHGYAHIDSADLSSVAITASMGSDGITVSASTLFENTLMRLAKIDNTPIAVSATATWSGSGATACIVALGTGNTSQSLSFESMTEAELHNCVPATNSVHDEALKISSVNSFHAGGLYTGGGYQISSVDHFDIETDAQTNMAPLKDPYEDLADPSDGISCTNTGYSSGNKYYPGTFCGDLTIDKSVTFMPGTYYIVNGGFKISSADNVSCDCTADGSGVTFVLTGTHKDNIGKIDISSIKSFDLQAPSDTSYDFPGLLFYVDRDAKQEESKFSSIIDMEFNGAIYAPSHQLTFGSIDFGGSECSQIISHQVKFSSIIEFGKTDKCSDYGTKEVNIGGSGAVRLAK